ncbi:MAG: hypothetical protein OXD01_06680 [Gammaproteobacteria bacterium]|nr:hypothetical protein [Gammaproteobacteria bacterium]
MARLKYVSVHAMAKQTALAMSVLGLIAGVFYSFGGFLQELATNSLNTGTALAFLALPGMPLLFAGCGLCLGILIAFVNNTATCLLLKRQTKMKD